MIDTIDSDFSGKKEVSEDSQVETAIQSEVLDEQSLISCGIEILELIDYFFWYYEK
jgi:hypothetical protein